LPATHPVTCSRRPSFDTTLLDGRQAQLEQLYGDAGPYSDFDWGMVNGKLSTLRWVLGSEWDFLDT